MAYTKMNANSTPLKPWYKQPWLLFIICFPACSVLLSSIMVYVAIVGGDSLVSDNYYKDGMAINQTFEQDRAADTHNIRPLATISIDGLVNIEILSTSMKPQPYLTLNLHHPTIRAEDVTIKLLPTESGFIGNIPSGVSGRRYLDLYSYDREWRIREEVTLPFKTHPLNQK